MAIVVDMNAATTAVTTPAALLDAAVALIESKSIRAWASSPQNRPVLLDHCKSILAKSGGSYEPLRYSTWLVCTAMGL